MEDDMAPLATELRLPVGTWNLDPAHTEIAFVIRHLMSKVRGTFTEFTGSIEIAEKVEDSRATVEIQVASISTRNADRDAHIRSAEILDLENHPVMRFEATGVRQDGDDYLLDGTLTVRNVTNPITLILEFNGVGEDPWGGTRAGFSATASISRKEYGVEFNIPFGGDKALLGDNVDILIEVQAVHA
jgi:polyisoprenoid-binding protein YceI